ncbi:hypothetical protein ACFL2V_11305 [Pseudomonadota bacterium]
MTDGPNEDVGEEVSIVAVLGVPAFCPAFLWGRGIEATVEKINDDQIDDQYLVTARNTTREALREALLTQTGTWIVEEGPPEKVSITVEGGIPGFFSSLLLQEDIVADTEDLGDGRYKITATKITKEALWEALSSRTKVNLIETE